ncbi:hypothetical protein Tco_0783505, partial [Tanacetum coccineum]
SDESPIPLPRASIAPPTVLPPSPVLPLSLMFDPQDFFLPEEILPSRKRARSRSSSSTSNELPLERIEHMEDKIEGLEQIRHDDEIVLARVRISTLEMLIEDIQVHHRSDMKSLLDKIHELKNHNGGPPDF